MRQIPVLVLLAACAPPEPGSPLPSAPPRPALSAHGLEARYGADGVTVSGLATVRLSLRAWGREDALLPAGPAAPAWDGSRVVYARPGIEEWWEERPDGLEQGFLVPAPPLGAGPLVLDLAVDGGAVDVEGDRAWISGMRYDGLYAWDDAGTDLPAWIEGTPGGIRLVVDDAEAVGAVWIDPLLRLAWTAAGTSIFGELGLRVASGGDVNGDGFADLIAGAPEHDSGLGASGRAVVWHGSATGPGPTPDWTVDSLHPLEHFGCSVDFAGDVDGDGYDDVVVGAYGNSSSSMTDRGAAYVYHGSAAGLDVVPAWSAYGDQDEDLLGWSAAAAGDVNGDGYDDVVVGAFKHTDPNFWEGAAYVYLGSPAGLSPTPAWSMQGGTFAAEAGYKVATAGDVNGDGYDDVAIGLLQGSLTIWKEGTVNVYAGSPTGPGALPSWIVAGGKANSLFSESLAPAGDVDGDGYDDLLVGAPQWFSDPAQFVEGAAWLFRGSALGLVTPAAWTVEGDLSSAVLGRSVAGAGDIDSDGFDDVAVGAPSWGGVGQVRVYRGSAAGLDPTPAFTASGTSSTYGYAVGGGGDVDGDGYDDILVGYPHYVDATGMVGRVLLYRGSCFDALDADGDTVGDACDLCPGHDDLEDADADASPDACDACEGFDDALDADGDTVPDGCDNCPATTDLDQHDGDLDGSGDRCDLCDGFDDALDADADGVPDGCEVCAGHPDGYDQDADSVPDGCDICPDADDRVDADADGHPDGCDACPDADDALDADLDRVPDACDLCAALDSPEEAATDADADAIPDVCDACPGFDDALDADRDRAPDACDACPDADDAIDADVDGTPDGCDLCASGADDLDADADAVPDACDLCPGEVGGFDRDGDGLATCSGDCHDGDAAVFTGAVEVPDGVDEDCDGRVDDGTVWADDDGDGFTEAGGDCDDVDGDVRPGTPELCDGLDGDCDGSVDDGTECADDDGDTFTELAGDCADADPLVFPGAFELLDNRIDDDCDGIVDPGHWDADGDGYEAGDCAPDDATVSPGAPETANGRDDDCDGLVDEGTRASDDDGDGLTEDAGDCDDASATTLPGAPELANRVDDDCDALVDEGTPNFDDDGDGQAEIGGDCDDGDAAVYGGAREVVNGVDDDCDGTMDEGTVDVDGDGWTVAQGDCDDGSGWASPEGLEVCDGVDNDCDGAVDDDCATTTPDVVVPVVAPDAGCDHTSGAGGAAVLAAFLAVGSRRRRASAASPASAHHPGAAPLVAQPQPAFSSPSSSEAT